MPARLSNRSRLVSQSEIRSMTIACAKAGGINLAQGVCDLTVPDPVIRGAVQAMHEGYNTYTRFDGLPELREAISRRMEADYGLNVDPEGEIVVSAGATGAFYATALALFNPGDEVIVFEPGYGYHATTLAALDVRTSVVRLAPPHWSFNERQLHDAASDRTRGIVINTPGNPTGKVFTRAELERIADFAVKRDLTVITDEIYEHFVYDGLSHVPPATLSELADRTVTISGFSKIYSITGWRLGYAICPPELARAIGHFSDLVYVCAPAPLQIGATRGLISLPPEYYREVAREHGRKRDRFCQALTSAGLAPHVPQGAYYALADISRLPGDTGRDRAMFLLEETGVACVPGEAFVSDPLARNLGRFCFAKKWPELEDACRRLEALA
ncbi:MAG: pyridoxal phosphate-dependent aminotransferase [Desulfovibrionaceae bacterium]